MPQPRPGHPFPRLVRYTETESLADSMGLPSRGRDYCVARLAQLGGRRVPVFANIGGFSAPGGAATKTRMLALEGVRVGASAQPSLAL